jgi:anti-sigma factor RsiW
MKPTAHPVDFSPYLDRDLTDPNYEIIRKHLESCASCRDQAAAWNSFDSMFRAPELELEVPASQWFQIRAKLQESRPEPGWLERISNLTRARQFALGLGLASFMMLSVIAGFWQYRHAGRQSELAAIAQYGEVEQVRLKSAANPFRGFEQHARNPFTDYQFSKIQAKGNPFAQR